VPPDFHPLPPEVKVPPDFHALQEIGLTLPDQPIVSLELESNKNGFIDEPDIVYEQLLLWFDFNHNGTSEDDELFGLAELGVERISVRYRKGQDVDEHGNEFRYVSRAWIRLENRLQAIPTADVFFVTSD